MALAVLSYGFASWTDAYFAKGYYQITSDGPSVIGIGSVLDMVGI